MFRNLTRATLILAAMLATTSCTDDRSPTAPTESLSVPAPGVVQGSLRSTLSDWGIDAKSPGTIIRTLGTLLNCRPKTPALTTKVVGPAGGTLVMGQHTLTIPAGALDREVEITGEVVRDWTNSVRFTPEGLAFATPAALTLGYRNCDRNDSPKQVAYTDESLNVLQMLPSSDRAQRWEVRGALDHFSRYAVAW